jgi:hypothetical protein
VLLAGCPLDEKISEMNLLAAGGHTIGALAVAAVDNPMCAATGHRICNDCMKACIYQKQEPVDIPQAETRILKDVLGLPWGFEIYGLLTRWNPLNLEPRRQGGAEVLVAGLGQPDAHICHGADNSRDRRAQIGHRPRFSVDAPGARVAIRDVASSQALKHRVMAGFGGVADTPCAGTELPQTCASCWSGSEFACSAACAGGTLTSTARSASTIALCAGPGGHHRADEERARRRRAPGLSFW